jgi:hypothetical protein
VLVDEVTESGAIARSTADAPEIDGVVHVSRSRKLKAGEFARVRVTRSDAHDLYAKACLIYRLPAATAAESSISPRKNRSASASRRVRRIGGRLSSMRRP